MRKTFEALGDDPEDDALHASRIAVKRARYAADLAAHELGKPGARFVAVAKQLQDILGDHQDAVVAQERIRDWAATSHLGGEHLRRRPARAARARPDGGCPRRLARNLAPSRSGSSRGGEVTRVVQAAGGVVLRESATGLEVLLVHRPAYDDWSFPKGKLERGESLEECALREVEEETGLHCTLGRELESTSYRDGKGRLKTRALLGDGGRRRLAALRLRDRRGALARTGRRSRPAELRARQRRAPGRRWKARVGVGSAQLRVREGRWRRC